MSYEPIIEHAPRSWTQRLGAILWPSFFAAGVMTMVFFAFVDPLDLREISFPNLEVEISRGFGYTICFFMFWSATASSSLFTWVLLRPASRFNTPLRDN